MGTAINLQNYRRADGTFELRGIFLLLLRTYNEDKYKYSSSGIDAALRFLGDVEAIEPISSPQAAAIAIATARGFARNPDSTG